MSIVYANTINELQKLFLRKKYIAFISISILIPLVAAFSFNLLQNKLGIFAVNTSSFSVLILGIFTKFLLPLYIFSSAADVFSGELGNKTLKLTLLRPITRFKVFLSKTISIGIFITLNLGIIFIFTLVAGLFINSTNQLASGVFQTLLAYILAIFPMLFLVIFAVFIAQFFKGSGSALTTCVFVYLVAKVIPFFSSSLAKINPFAYSDWYLMWIGSSFDLVKLLNVFLLLLSYSLILFAAGFYFFDKRDL